MGWEKIEYDELRDETYDAKYLVKIQKGKMRKSTQSTFLQRCGRKRKEKIKYREGWKDFIVLSRNMDIERRQEKGSAMKVKMNAKLEAIKDAYEVEMNEVDNILRG